MVLSFNTADREYVRRQFLGNEDEDSQDDAITEHAGTALIDLQQAIKNVGGDTPVSDDDATDGHHKALRSCTLMYLYSEKGGQVGPNSNGGFWERRCAKDIEAVVESVKQEPTSKSSPPRVYGAKWQSNLITEEPYSDNTSTNPS